VSGGGIDSRRRTPSVPTHRAYDRRICRAGCDDWTAYATPGAGCVGPATRAALAHTVRADAQDVRPSHLPAGV